MSIKETWINHNHMKYGQYVCRYNEVSALWKKSTNSIDIVIPAPLPSAL